MNRNSGPFSAKGVLTLLIVGFSAFLLLLYALGAGWTGQQDRNGGAHAASNGLTGYAALVGLLERRGAEVALSRSEGGLNDRGLLVLTPDQYTDADTIARIIEDRRWLGPTLIILPKWGAFPVPDDPRIEAEDGWVVLADPFSPSWLGDVEPMAEIVLVTGETRGWRGFGLSGTLASPDTTQGAEADANTALIPLVTDTEGDILAGYLDRGGYHPDLADAAGVAFTADEEEAQLEGMWPVVVVLEPDLFNNYGLADESRARLAVTLIEASMDSFEADLPVVFDLTVVGLGAGENLLTLAFRPPFLAATLVLLLAALVIGWRGFRRFGPAHAEAPAMARGKRQLARNGAALVERARRWHLLGEPYAALVAARIAGALGIRQKETAAREAAIDAAMAQRGLDTAPFSRSAQALRTATRPADILRNAAALRSIERTLVK